MIKSSVLIVCFFVLFQDGNSQETIGSGFFGGCPEVKNEITTPSSVSGRWYTHWVSVSDYSPLKYFPCLSHVLDLLASRPPRIVTKFSLPFLRTPYQIEGELQSKEDNKYMFKFNYNIPIFGYVPQKTAILNYRPSGGAILLWTCTDFKLFHFESVQVMTRIYDGAANLNDQAFTSMSYVMNKYGLVPESFVKVDQSCK